jgi:putative heme-binding domain-containing protein
MVRFQVALSLGDVTDGRAIGALAAIADQGKDDQWTRAAVLSSIVNRTRSMIEALAAFRGFFDTPSGRQWLVELAMLTGAENRPDDVRAILERFATEETDLDRAAALILGLGRGLRRSGGSLAGALAGPASAKVAPLFVRASRIALDAGAEPVARVDAIRLLALGSADEALKVLPSLLDARQPSGVQVAAVQGLADLQDHRVGQAIADRWKAMGPSIRREAAEVLFARPDRLEALLSAIESKAVAAADLDPSRRKGLLESGDPRVKARASALFSGLERPERSAVIARGRKALELPGAPDRGKVVFARACATCHRAEGQGSQVGPDMATVAARSPEDILIHILDPNREVAANYVNYAVVLKDGRTVSGLIAEESAGALTLRRAEGATDVVLRGQIEEIASTGLSLMPEGLEQGIDPQGMADLIAYLRSLGSRN